MTTIDTGYREQLADLVRGAKQNDQDKLTALVTELYPIVYKYTLARMGNNTGDMAEDITQETLIKAMISLNTLSDPGAVRTWVKHIAENKIKDYYRSAPVKNTVNFSALDNTEDELDYDPADERITYQPEMAYNETARQEIVLDVLNTLPEEQRQVVMLKFYENMTIDQISSYLDIPTSTVVGRLQKGKEKVKLRVSEIQTSEGIKLYGMAPLPFFLAIFRDWRGVSYLRGTAAGVVTATTAAAGTAGTAGSAGTGSGLKTAGTITAKAAKSAAAVKIGVAAGTAAVVIGGGAAIHSYVASRQNEPVIGEVTVVADKVDIWKVPSTHSTDIGDAVQGVSYDVYEVLIGGSVWYPKDSDRYEDMEVISDKGYTWYRIDNNGWIADNGSWVTYTGK